MIKTLRICFLTLALVWLTGCAGKTDPADAYKGESEAEIYQKGRGALRDNNYTEAVKRFEALEVQYPFGRYTEQGQLDLIYAYYMKEDYALAVNAANHFIRLHPTSPHVDYAYYMRGVSDYYQNMGVLERIFAIDLATRDLTQIRKAYNDFNEIIERFPNSKYAPASHQYLVYLRNTLADHELHIAEYYYTRKAYIASANRASGIVTRFQGAPAVRNALIIMAKSYNRLGLAKEKQDTLRVLEINFPGTVVDYNSTY